MLPDPVPRSVRVGESGSGRVPKVWLEKLDTYEGAYNEAVGVEEVLLDAGWDDWGRSRALRMTVTTPAPKSTMNTTCCELTPKVRRS